MPASLKQLRYLCAVADCGSVLRAAETLRIAQSSIHAAIEAAEGDLGARIFERRRGRGARPTRAGLGFLEAARRLIAAESRFQQEIGTMEAGLGALRIGCFEPFASIFLIEILSQMQARLGSFDVTLVEGDQPRLKRFLDRGDVDIVLAYDLGPDFEGDVTQIQPAPPHGLVRADGPLGRRESVSIAEFAQAGPLVLLSQPMTVTYLLTLLGSQDPPPRIGFKARSYDTVIRAVAAGFGNAIMNLRPPRPLDIEAGCKRLRFAGELPAPMLIAVDNYGPRKPRLVSEFLDELRAYFAPWRMPEPAPLRPR